LTPDTLGGAKIKGYTSLEEAELVKTTLIPLAAPVTTEPGACGGDPTTLGQVRCDDHRRRLRHGCPDPICAHDGKDRRDHGVRIWDALVEACRRLQATDNLPHTHATTARLTLTMSLEDLRDRLDTQGLLPSGDTLSAAAVRRRPVMPTSSPRSSVLRVRSSTWAAPAGWSPPASGPRWSSATNTAPSPAARDSPWPATPTTSNIGPTEDPPRWTTWSCCSAGNTTP
jgi:hypothetical protein